jgi:hypothetical protein
MASLFALFRGSAELINGDIHFRLAFQAHDALFDEPTVISYFRLYQDSLLR